MCARKLRWEREQGCRSRRGGSFSSLLVAGPMGHKGRSRRSNGGRGVIFPDSHRSTKHQPVIQHDLGADFIASALGRPATQYLNSHFSRMRGCDRPSLEEYSKIEAILHRTTLSVHSRIDMLIQKVKLSRHSSSSNLLA